MEIDYKLEHGRMLSYIESLAHRSKWLLDRGPIGGEHSDIFIRSVNRGCTDFLDPVRRAGPTAIQDPSHVIDWCLGKMLGRKT